MKNKIIAISIVCACFVFGASKIEKQINDNTSKLNSTEAQIAMTDKKIQQLANEINSQNSTLTNIQMQIVTLNKLIAGNKSSIEEASVEVIALQQSAEQITKTKQEQENRFSQIIIEEFASSKAKELKNTQTKEDVITNEVYELLNTVTSEELKKLDEAYTLVNQNKNSQEARITEVKGHLKQNSTKKEQLAALEKAQLQSIGSLEKKHIAYQNQLAKTQETQKKLTSILKQLNILKSQQVVVKSEPKKQTRKNFLDDLNETQKQEYKIVSPKINVDVKKIGSSTGEIKIAGYNGQKTIAPLKNFSIVKRFGKYYDDVYNMEFFNESVTLAAREADSKVYSVLPGKVIYEKKNQSILDNVVIISHPNGLHTIYSHLDQISPTITTGKYIEGGYVIGRVSGSLIFQATQNNAFIDPLQMIN